METAFSVGFNPTIALRVDGEIIEPTVSEPRETAAKFADIDTAEPLLEPGEGYVYCLDSFAHKTAKKAVQPEVS